jgi:hypothetical protein
MNKIPIFVSSAHYGLEDLRGELASYLDEQLGVLPLISSERGFPDYPGIPPYSQCLRVLETALIVVGVIDRRYGATFDEWGPYPQYRGLSPTHAELRHALSERKRLMIFVRAEVQGYYDIFRKNRDAFENLALPNGLELGSLRMFEELKLANPAPWIESFRDIRDIKESIRRRLLHDLYDSLKQRETLARLGAEFLLERIVKLDPELRQRLIGALGQESPDQEAKLNRYLEYIQSEESVTLRDADTEIFAYYDSLLQGGGDLASSLLENALELVAM